MSKREKKIYEALKFLYGLKHFKNEKYKDHPLIRATGYGVVTSLKILNIINHGVNKEYFWVGRAPDEQMAQDVASDLRTRANISQQVKRKKTNGGTSAYLIEKMLETLIHLNAVYYLPNSTPIGEHLKDLKSRGPALETVLLNNKIIMENKDGLWEWDSKTKVNTKLARQLDKESQLISNRMNNQNSDNSGISIRLNSLAERVRKIEIKLGI